jgi:hypothetical protein
VWHVEGGQHLTAVLEGPEAYRSTLAEFLAEALEPRETMRAVQAPAN